MSDTKELITRIVLENAEELKLRFPPGWGFVTFGFDYQGPNMVYASTANKADVIKALKEFIQKAESGEL